MISMSQTAANDRRALCAGGVIRALRRAALLVLVGVVAAAAAPARPARAQLPVIDPANLAQSILQAAHALEQIHNQVQQIDQQTKMLARNPLQLSPELSRAVDEARGLFTSARAIAFEIERMNADIRALYPETWERLELAEVGARTQAWLAADREALERAMRAQAQAARSLEGSRAHIDRALAASADAEGQTGAVQAGNQLLGINAAQLAEIHALLIAQGRALATERLERVSRETRALEIQRRAFPTSREDALPPARPAFGR
ncbi:MAG: hypothetical protein JNM47_16300 [Hyphomonadaceae bacterium]|nr:hypothetical protein [Hyphomonadaceae bacterium]